MHPCVSMRGPRYRFPEHVRSTTREIAARMIRDDEVVETPGQFESWISLHPDARAALEEGGYGSEFDAEDLFPLLQVRLPAVAAAVEARPARGRPRRAVLVAALVAILVALAIVFGALG